MDVNRRHLIGAAGIAGALAVSTDAARAAPLASSLGRDVTQYGVRPGSPDDQTKNLQRAIDEAARAQVRQHLGLVRQHCGGHIPRAREGRFERAELLHRAADVCERRRDELARSEGEMAQKAADLRKRISVRFPAIEAANGPDRQWQRAGYFPPAAR